MKKVIYAIAALLLVVGCSKEQDLTPETPSLKIPEVVTAGFENLESRTYVDDDLYQWWTEDDRISVFTGTTANQQYRYTGETGEDAGVFELYGTASSTGATITKNYAVYPYANTTLLQTTGAITYTLPTTQAYAEDSFGLGANTMVAATTSTDETEFAFKNVGGYIRLYLYGNNITVKEVRLQSNAHEKLSGKATLTIEPNALPTCTMQTSGKEYVAVDCGEGVKIGATEAEATPFWFVVPAGEMTEGFTVTITDVNGYTMTKSTEKAYTVKRNEVKSMTPFEVELKIVDPNLIFDAQFNADGTATDLGKYEMAITAKLSDDMSVITDPNIPFNNVARFDRVAHNRSYPNGVTTTTLSDGFYEIDFSENQNFIADLQDGFTFEIVASLPTSGPDIFQMIGFLGGVEIQYRGGTNTIWLCGENNSGNTSYTPELYKYTHYVGVYDANASTVTLYINGQGKGQKTGFAFNSATTFAIGGLSLNGGMSQRFSGDIALMRVYNNVMTADEVKARTTELALPKAAAPFANTSPTILDLQFNAGATATDISASNMKVETARDANGSVYSNLQVVNGVAVFDPATAEHTTAGSYFTVDCTQGDFNNKYVDGYTLEYIIALPNSQMASGWKSLFGTDQFRYISLSNNSGDTNRPKLYWYDPTSNSQKETSGIPFYTPLTNWTHYYHCFIVYKVNGDKAEMHFYVDGKYDFNNPWPNSADTDPTLALDLPKLNAPKKMIIGATYSAINNVNASIDRIWRGNIAAFRIYDEPFTNTQIGSRTAQMKETIAALDATLR